MEEYISFLIQAAGTDDFDVPAAAARWSAAATIVEGLAQAEAGLADGATADALPPEFDCPATEYLSDPAVANSYVGLHAAVRMVELDRVVVFQRAINLRYTEELGQLIGDGHGANLDLLRFCLAIDQPQPPISAIQVAPNQFVFSSTSTDTRLLSARLVDAAHVSAQTTAGRPHSAVVLQVGYGVNALNVLSVNGRLILNNGSHRAYALRAAGVTHAPAVVQTIARPDQLNIVPQVQQNLEMYLGGTRPPMLKDYFNPELNEVIYAPRKLRQVRVQFGVEQLDAPG
jgi:hypothetical protein